MDGSWKNNTAPLWTFQTFKESRLELKFNRRSRVYEELSLLIAIRSDQKTMA